jgi:hypothetical protein
MNFAKFNLNARRIATSCFVLAAVVSCVLYADSTLGRKLRDKQTAAKGAVEEYLKLKIVYVTVDNCPLINGQYVCRVSFRDQCKPNPFALTSYAVAVTESPSPARKQNSFVGKLITVSLSTN